MRPDQLAQLNDLAEKLADVFLAEADPDNWTAAGKLPMDMTQQERGDRHWDRKGAVGTGAVLNHTLNLIAHHKTGGTAEETDENDDLDKRIQEAHRRAAAQVKAVLNKAQNKSEFDRRVHGKG